MVKKCPRPKKRTFLQLFVVGLSLLAAFVSLGQYFGVLSVASGSNIEAPPINVLTIVLVAGMFYLAFLWWNSTRK